MKRAGVLAIDGPASSGKTTSAREVARRLGLAYLDSGALYRAIAFAAHEQGLRAADGPQIDRLAVELPLRAEAGAGSFRVFVGGRGLSEELRDPEVTALASKIAVRPAVRQRVVACLRQLAEEGACVVEGRDIGTVVFPEAELKVFLTASASERARRRARELEKQGHPVDLQEVIRQIEERDARDASRSIAPLLRAPDAVVIDTTRTDIDGQVSRILEAWAERVPPRIRIGYGLHRFLIRLSARLLWGLVVEGAGNVPRAGGLILVSNHKSYLDPLLVGAVVPREIHYLAKRELFGVPILKSWVRWNNAIPIDRDRFDRAAIEGALALLGSGGALLIFPEGTRIRRPGLGAPREGVAWIASRAQVPVVPVHIRGSWARDRRWFRRGGIRIRIGEPFRLPATAPGRAGRAQLPAIAERIMEAIGSLARAGESS